MIMNVETKANDTNMILVTNINSIHNDKTWSR